MIEVDKFLVSIGYLKGEPMLSAESANQKSK